MWRRCRASAAEQLASSAPPPPPPSQLELEGPPLERSLTTLSVCSDMLNEGDRRKLADRTVHVQ